MTASPLPASQSTGRRMAASLIIALVLHGLVALIPTHRWLGNHPGDAAGLGGGDRSWTGQILGAEVAIRLPEPTSASADAAANAQEESGAQPAAEAPPQPLVASEALDAAALSVEVIPPRRTPGGSGASGSGSAMDAGGVPRGSLAPLGGGGVQLEMALDPVSWPVAARLLEIVVERGLENEEIIVQVLVDRDGHVIDERMLRSIPGCPECNASAVEAARAHVFRPPVHEGQSVQAWVTLRWDFGREVTPRGTDP